MGRQVQTAGVAPTDDCFTVVAPGPDDTDQDGPALIGDPDKFLVKLLIYIKTLFQFSPSYDSFFINYIFGLIYNFDH